MTPVEKLILRLDKVKGRNGSWTARCPAHADKGPSLAVREGDDGRVLLHCFAGCETANVLGAIGMDMTDLFPPDEKRPDAHHSL
jgi:DNA primase